MELGSRRISVAEAFPRVENDVEDEPSEAGMLEQPATNIASIASARFFISYLHKSVQNGTVPVHRKGSV